MYSRYFPFVTAQARPTCSSIRKCGQTDMSKASTACEILSQGGDPANARHVDLHDRACASRHIFAEAPDRVHRLRNRDRRPGRPGKPDTGVAIVRWQRLLDPREVEVGEAPRSADCLLESESLIGIGHDFIVGAQRRGRGGQSPVAPPAQGRSILIFEPMKPCSRTAIASWTSVCSSICSQPPSVV
jgi:hypothetical protein